jgi:hypothetical protein
MLPSPRENRIDREYIQNLVLKLEEILQRVYRKDADLLINPQVRLVLVSPNGTRYRVKVDNNGVLSTEVV